MSLDAQDRDLIEKARRTAEALLVVDRHEVAAAVRTGSGKVFTGINIQTGESFANVCGEVAAVCCMVAGGSVDLDTIVAVRVNGRGESKILSPCGRCREIIHDFNPRAWVIVGAIGAERKVPISDLLPMKREKGA
jgi:cytidine deaminase